MLSNVRQIGLPPVINGSTNKPVKDTAKSKENPKLKDKHHSEPSKLSDITCENSKS